MGQPVPRVTVRESSSPDDITPYGTSPPPSHPCAPRLSPQHTGDNNDIEDAVSLTSAEDFVAASAENLGHVFNGIPEPGDYSDIVHDGDMPLLPIEIELIEEERARAKAVARDRAFAQAFSEASQGQAGPSSGYAGGAPQDHRGPHGHRCAWHGLSLAATRTSHASVPDGCICANNFPDGIIRHAAPAACSVPRPLPAYRMNTNNTSSSLGGFSITQHVFGSPASIEFHPNTLDWPVDSIATINGSSSNYLQRYLDGPFPSNLHRSFRPADAAAHELAREAEKQFQADAPTERGSLESNPDLNPVVGTAMSGRVVTPSVISIHTISPPASVYNGVPKSTFMVDNSALDERLRNFAAPGGVTGYDSPGTNRARGRSRERRDSSTCHSFSSLSHFAYLTVDTSLRTKIFCLIILCVFLTLSGSVVWLMSEKKMHIAAGILSLFILGAATLKLGSECLRAFGLKKGKVSDLERSVGMGQKNVTSLI